MYENISILINKFNFKKITKNVELIYPMVGK